MNPDRRRILALGASALAGSSLSSGRRRPTAPHWCRRQSTASPAFRRRRAAWWSWTTPAPRGGPHTIPPRACSSAARSRPSSCAIYARGRAGRLTEDQQVKVDDAVRSLSSSVFLNLTGTTQARSALEAMIAHSDNTATDITLAAAGPAQVRALIAEAGLKQTQIPELTRRLFSYIAGAPEGVDLGWDGVLRAQNAACPARRAPRSTTRRRW